jgi:hypothetical protein
MVMLLRLSIAPELFIAGNLIRVQQRARFQMRRKVHGALARKIHQAT